MPQLTIVDRDAAETPTEFNPGISVMEVIRDAGVDVEPFALCGGACSCATCHVYVQDAFLDKFPAMSADEADLLDGSGFRQPNSRLSCQLPCTESTDGMRVTVAPAD